MLILTKQIIRDKLYFSGTITALDLADKCGMGHSKESEQQVTFFLESLKNDGLVVETNGMFSMVEDFKLKGF
jgi:predicted ArsR family transcriptional regulator